MGFADMISEKFFIENYSSFWKELFPMSLFFIKGVNLKNKECVYHSLYTEGRRISFISQLSFILAERVLMKKISKEELLTLRQADKSFSLVFEYAKKQILQYPDADERLVDALDEGEFIDVIELAKRLITFFNYGDNIKFSPMIKGCGFLDNCYGDLLLDKTLWEIKCVNHSFKMNDFKQLFTYVAFNSISRQYDIERIGLYNPRNNANFEINVNEFARIVSGREYNDLCLSLISFVTNENQSK
jgi:hypothetical protein